MKRLRNILRAWSRIWGRLEALAIVGALFAGACVQQPAAAPVLGLATCDAAVHDHVASAPTCKAAEEAINADPACAGAPHRINLNCKEDR